MKSVLSNSPSLCVQGRTNSPSLLHRTASLLLLNTPVETGGRACGCRGPHRCMYNQVLHRSSQLTRQTRAFQLLFQTYGWKKKQTLSVQFRQPKSGSNKEGRGEEMRARKTDADNVWKHWEQRSPRTVPLAWGLGIVSSSSCQVLKVNATVEIVFHCDIFLFPILSLSGLFTELDVVGAGGGGLGWWVGATLEKGWFFTSQRAPQWARLESILPWR